MPRRAIEVAQVPVHPKKKTKLSDELSPSLDVSFCDDEALPPGIVFCDVLQKKWRIGKPIGEFHARFISYSVEKVPDIFLNFLNDFILNSVNLDIKKC